jgi:hypothetical protein
MIAYAVLLLAIASRILPPFFHTASWNFTAMGGGLLFFGSRMRGSSDAASARWMIAARLASAIAALAVADWFLTTHVYGYAFHASEYAVTWIWYAAICLLGMGLLQRPSVLRVAVAALAAPTSFFLLSNGMCWVGSTMYAHTLAGLGACLAAGVPFYRNDLVSTALTAGVLFGLPALAARIAESARAAHDHPLA